MKKFKPTYYFDNVYMTDSTFFISEGIKNIILDIDNTLISNTVEVGDEKLYGWIDELKNAGIKLCIVSNGKGARVKKFNENIGLPTVFEALKPTQKGYVEALKIMDAKKEEKYEDFLQVHFGHRGLDSSYSGIRWWPYDKHKPERTLLA